MTERRAKITSRDGYRCAPHGHTIETFAFGAIVTGRVAEMALADRAASAMFNPVEETKITPPDEVKATAKPRGRGRPRKNAKGS